MFMRRMAKWVLPTVALSLPLYWCMSGRFAERIALCGGYEWRLGPKQNSQILHAGEVVVSGDMQIRILEDGIEGYRHDGTRKTFFINAKSGSIEWRDGLRDRVATNGLSGVFYCVASVMGPYGKPCREQFMQDLRILHRNCE